MKLISQYHREHSLKEVCKKIVQRSFSVDAVASFCARFYFAEEFQMLLEPICALVDVIWRQSQPYIPVGHLIYVRMYGVFAGSIAVLTGPAFSPSCW